MNRSSTYRAAGVSVVVLGIVLTSAAEWLAGSQSEIVRARELISRGQYAQAQDALVDLVRHGNADPEAHALFGVAVLHLGDYAAALEHLTVAVNANPQDAAALKALCKASILAGRIHDAEKLLRRLTDLAPADAEAWSLLGRVYQDSSRFEEAAGALRHALTLEPQDVHALSALANAQVGLGLHEDAFATFTRSVQVNRRLARPLASTHASFAVYLLRLDRISEAREQLRLAEAIAPDEPVTMLAARALRGRVPETGRPAGRGAPSGPPPSFTDITAAANLDFRLENSPTIRKHQIETMAGGVAVLDFDNDGLMDIYFTNGAESPSLKKTGPEHWNRLYRNNGDGTFSDVTIRAGVQGTGYMMGAAAGDFDNDGFTDLFVAGVDRNVLYRNNGDGTFSDVTGPAGLDLPHPVFGRMWGIHATWFDYDNDGWLDLLVVNYCRWDPATEPACGDPASGRVSYCHPSRYAPLPNLLYRNNGNGTFTDVSESSGIGRHLGKGMGAAVADLDGDGLLDVFVANDTEPNFLFWNRGGGRFDEMALSRGVAVNQFGQAVSAMGVDWRDLDEDGRPDLFVTALSNEGFLLFRNAPGTFDDIADRSRMGLASLPYSGWSNAIVDLDNDGRKDLFSANGHALDDIEGSQDRAYRQRNVVFQNLGDGIFREVAAEGGLARRAAHRGAAVADFDNDGRMDIIVTALGERPSLLRNTSAPRAHWLLVKLVGRLSNRSGIGAVLRLEAGDGRVLWNHATTSVGFASSSDPRVHFGLGEGSSIRQLEVRWPSGVRQVLEDVRPNQILEVIEPEQGSGRTTR